MVALVSNWLKHFDFSSVNPERNTTKLNKKPDLNALYHVCVFLADRKNKMTALTSDWLRHFYISSETAWRNTTKLNRNPNLNVLYQTCVFGPIRHPRWPPWRNCIERKITLYSTECVFSGPIGKVRWPPSPW